MNTKLLDFLSDLFSFKLINDDCGNEFILFRSNPLDSVGGIDDKTQFEATENHIHICDNVKPKQFNGLTDIGEALGKALLHALSAEYPSKNFTVYVTVTLKDSMIIRFHQSWVNETPYYENAPSRSPTEVILKFVS